MDRQAERRIQPIQWTACVQKQSKDLMQWAYNHNNAPQKIFKIYRSRSYLSFSNLASLEYRALRMLHKMDLFLTEGWNTSETSYTFWRNPENPKGIPNESHGILRVLLNLTESKRILWTALESPKIPKNSQEYPRIPENFLNVQVTTVTNREEISFGHQKYSLPLTKMLTIGLSHFGCIQPQRLFWGGGL